MLSWQKIGIVQIITEQKCYGPQGQGTMGYGPILDEQPVFMNTGDSHQEPVISFWGPELKKFEEFRPAERKSIFVKSVVNDSTIEFLTQIF